MRHFVMIEFEFESDTEDGNEFAEEVWAVMSGVQFVDRFDSATRCVDFKIMERNV